MDILTIGQNVYSPPMFEVTMRMNDLRLCPALDFYGQEILIYPTSISDLSKDAPEWI